MHPRSALLCLSALLVLACDPRVDGRCRTQADCREGTVCQREDGKAEGLCLVVSTPGCTLACGEGFRCTTPDTTTQRCEPNPGVTLTASLLAPAPNAVTAGGTLLLRCAATGPQFRSVTLSAVDASGATATFTDVVSPQPGLYEATWDSSTAPDGLATVGCTAWFGPDDFVRDVTATPAVVRIDRRAPVVTVDAVSGSREAGDTLTLQARIEDDGTGVVGATVAARIAGVGEFEGTQLGADIWAFDIDLSKLPSSMEGSVEATIVATDYAGNVGTGQTTFVFVERPTVVIEADNSWHKGGDAVLVHVYASDEGSGLDGVSIAGGAPCLATGADAFDCVIPTAGTSPSTLTPPFLVTFDIEATDMQRNQRLVGGTLRVDDRPPKVTVEPIAGIREAGDSLTVRAQITEEGSGLAPASIRAIVDGIEESEGSQLGANDWVFNIDLAQLSPKREGSVVIRVSAADVAGNAVSSDTSFTFVEHPSVTINADTSWHLLGESVTIGVLATDAGTGIASVRVVGAEEACTAVASDRFDCTVQADSAMAGGESDAFVFSIEAVDGNDNRQTARSSLKVDDRAPSLKLTSSVDDWFARSRPFALEGTATDGGSGVDGSTVGLIVGASRFPATSLGADGKFSITVDPKVFAAAGAATTTPFTLEASDAMGLRASVSGNLLVDDVRPSITPDAVAYPDYRATEAHDYVRRNDALLLSALVADPAPGAGLDDATVVLTYTRNDGTAARVPGQRHGGAFHFAFSARDVQFFTGVGNVDVTFRAADLRGNEASQKVPVKLSRVVWDFDSGTGYEANGGIALSSSDVFATFPSTVTLPLNPASADNVFSISRETGLKNWGLKSVGTPRSAPILYGDELIFKGSDLNQAPYIESIPQASPISKSWRCNLNASALGGFAIGRLDWFNSDQGSVDAGVRTIFAHSSAGVLWRVRQRGTGCESIPTTITTGFNGSGSTVSFDEKNSRIWIGMTSGRFAYYKYNVAALSFESPTFRTVAPSDTQSIPGVSLTESGNPVTASTETIAEWTFATSSGLETLSSTPVIIGELASQSVGDSTVILGPSNSGYYTTLSGLIYRFEFGSGTSSDGFPVAVASPPRGSPTIDKAGTAYVVTEDGYLRAIGSDGAVRWTHFLGAQSVSSSSPALSCDGTIYVGTSHGHVVALQADSDGIADSSWPKYQHDNRNTGNLATKIYDNGVCVE
ncbi:MAG: hypothetical protein RL199_262 [Pseudomonadota bacterium]|jgi:hypothetical protein